MEQWCVMHNSSCSRALSTSMDAKPEEPMLQACQPFPLTPKQCQIDLRKHDSTANFKPWPLHCQISVQPTLTVLETVQTTWKWATKLCRRKWKKGFSTKTAHYWWGAKKFYVPPFKTPSKSSEETSLTQCQVGGIFWGCAGTKLFDPSATQSPFS